MIVLNEVLTPAQVRQISVYDSIVDTDTGKTQLEDVEDCPVCFEAIQYAETKQTTPCNHSFHTVCLQRWLHTATTCPVCRNPLTGASAS